MLKNFDYTIIPTVEIVNEMIYDALNNNIEYIYIESMDNNLEIKFEKNKQIKKYAEIPKNYESNILNRIKIISSINMFKPKLEQTGFLKISIRGRIGDFSVISIPSVNSEKIIMRVDSIE